MALSVGMVGVGCVSDEHLGALSAMPDVKITSVADVDEDVLIKQAKRYAVDGAYEDYRRLLDDKSVDVVYICVPHNLHCEIALQAFAAGKHVVCEKPLAMNAAEADLMLAAARQNGRKLLITENHRFYPRHIRARQLLASGAIGSPMMCISTFIGNEIARMNDAEHWKGTVEHSGGGVVIDNGFHMIDTLRSFFGEVDSVQAIIRQQRIKLPGKAEDSAFVVLSFSSGVLADLSLTFAAGYNVFPKNYIGAGVRFEIVGTDGAMAILNDANCELAVVSESGRKEYSEQEVVGCLDEGSITDMHRHVIDCLTKDVKPVVTAEDGRETMAVIDAVYASARCGREIQVADSMASTGDPSSVAEDNSAERRSGSGKRTFVRR